MKAAARGARHTHEVIRRASVAGWCLNIAKKMVPRTATPSEVDNCCEDVAPDAFATANARMTEVYDLVQMTLTLRASSPFRPAAISNSTC